MSKDVMDGFDRWLDEIEVFSLRQERLIGEIQANPSPATILAWARAAYDEGYSDGRSDGYDQAMIDEADQQASE